MKRRSVCFLWIIFVLISAALTFADEVQVKTTYPSREGKFNDLTVEKIILTPQSPAIDPTLPTETQGLPAPREKGEIYYDKELARLRFFNGNEWEDLAQEVSHVTTVLAKITQTDNPNASFTTGLTRRSGGFLGTWVPSEVFAGDACGVSPCTKPATETSPPSTALEVRMHGAGNYTANWWGNLWIDADKDILVQACLQFRNMSYDSKHVWKGSRWTTWLTIDAPLDTGFGDGKGVTFSISDSSDNTIPLSITKLLPYVPARQFRLIVTSKKLSSTANLDNATVVMKRGFYQSVTKE